MIEDIRKTVEQYHEQFQQAETDEERVRLASAHQAFIEQLTEEQQQTARAAARPYLLKAAALVEGFEPTLQRALDMIDRANAKRLAKVE